MNNINANTVFGVHVRSQIPNHIEQYLYTNHDSRSPFLSFIVKLTRQTSDLAYLLVKLSLYMLVSKARALIE